MTSWINGDNSSLANKGACPQTWVEVTAHVSEGQGQISVLSLPAEQHSSPSPFCSAGLFSSKQKPSRSVPLWKTRTSLNPYKARACHAYGSRHPPMLRGGDLCPLAYSLTTPARVSWMTRGEGDSHPQIFRSSGERWSKACELWPFCYFSGFFLTPCFHWKELGVLLCPGQSSPVRAQLCGLPRAAIPSFGPSSLGLVSWDVPVQETQGYLYPPM